MWPLEQLKPYPGNPRQNLQTIDQVVASLDEFGWRQPIVVDADGVIVVGHTRYFAAERRGDTHVPVHVATGLSPAQVRAYRIADNRIADESDWDQELLVDELKAILDDGTVEVSVTGFSALELDTLLAEAQGKGNRLDPDAAPAKPDQAVTKPGDTWLLGAHRLRCGDARRMADLRAATDNRLVDVIWTDPPYNVDYTAKSKALAGRKIANDKMAAHAFQSFLLALMRGAFKMAKAGAPIYVAHADIEGLAFRQAFVAAGFKLSGCLIWRKQQLVLGRSDYQWQHEPILYGWKPGAAHPWYGGRRKTTVAELGADSPFEELADGRWQLNLGDEILIVEGAATVESFAPTIVEAEKPTSSALHPTMKPTALIESQLANSCKPGALVLDLCGGSGSTLIACERLGLRAALVELDPAYCDVIVGRWETYTGEKAVKAEARADADAVVPAKAVKRARRKRRAAP